MADPPVRIGDVVAGKYRVDRVLGEGGMGIVLAAQHLQLDERVALKFLHGEAAQQADLVARFMREARMSAKIRSDHVARVTDVGVLESGVPYMVMEYLEGQDLASLVEEGPPLSVTRAIDLLLQACEAIAVAHSLGIVHRDLKPSNLFVTRHRDGAPFVKVLDFGISKIASEPGELALTRTNALVGSPYYMSPEQMLDSRSVDSRSDVWAAGVVLYEMLAGVPPFEGATIPEVSARIAASPHTPIQSARPDVPDALAAIIDRTLAKRPGDRFASIAELARALLPFAPAESAPSVRRIEATARGSDPRLSNTPPEASSAKNVLAIEHGETVAADARSTPARDPRPARAGDGRIRFAVAGAAGVLLLVALTGAAWSWSRRTTQTHDPVAPPAAVASSSAEPSVPQPSVTLASTAIVIPPPPVASSAHASVAKLPPAAARPTTRASSATAPPPPPATTAVTPPPPPPFDSRK